MRLWILFGLAAAAILGSGVPVVRDAHHSESSESVFASILHDDYASWTGFHACLPGQAPQHDACWAELRKGDRYRQFAIDVDRSQATPVPSVLANPPPWTRQPVYVVGQAGRGSANTTAYDWDYLMAHVSKVSLPTTFLDVRGVSTGHPPALFSFACTTAATRITCRNALGDAITFTPSGV